MKRHVLLTLFLGCLATLGFAQTGKYWSENKKSPGDIKTDKAVARLSFPKEFKLFALNIEELRNELFTITDNRLRHKTVITIPNVSGQLEDFEVVEASNFEPALQARFPEIRAFSGRGITDRTAILKLSYSPQGIQTMVFRTEKKNEFIEAYSSDHTIYAVFESYRQPGTLNWTCSTPQEQEITQSLNARPPMPANANTGELKTMRLAQSCNGEYSNYFGATSAAQVNLVLAAFNATLTRCNGCYEKDLAIHLNLIANTTDVIYYNPGTDPYTNLGAWNGQLQSTLTSVIGEANYDIGHMFGASGGGGNAGCIGCVCVNGSKGSGITSPADGIPQGDNFDIDYVAHEVGHQLGGNHTFSFQLEGTGVNKEVGSGITIMGYAGITNQDVAPHSIDIFHEASIAQIQANMATKSCPVTTNISGTNATPVVAALSNWTIPKTTPFRLTGSATDANAGDVLTYCWEQDDNSTTSGNASVASQTKATGPNWLSFSPTTSPTRICPRLSTILAGLYVTPTLPGGDAIANIEALSSVGRNLKFRLTVRDNAVYSSTAPLSVGQTAFQDLTVTVDASTGPFQVTTANTATSWQATSTQTITWDVAGTTGAPINCSFVNIKLSTDGGQTFPITLAANTANDGTESIVVPNNITTTGRIMVESVGNIFFDINNANLTITTPPTGFTFSSPAATNVACGTAPSANVALGTTASGGFSTPINLTAAGNPAGTTVTFSPNPLTPGNSTTVTLNNVNTLVPGSYPVTITGVAGAVTQSVDVVFVVQPGTAPAIGTQPAAATACEGSAASFTVNASGSGLTYQWQVSTDAGATWTNIVGAISATYNIASVTASQNDYRYRVIISTLCASTTSNAVALTVNAAPAISQQPADAAVCTNNDITFSVGATGAGLSYQWQLSTDGGNTWNNIGGAIAATYTITGVTIAENGNKYRVIINGTCPSAVTSSAATLSVTTAVGISAQPVSQVVCSGSNADFTVTGTGTGVNYQWQVSTNGGTTWTNISGGNASTLTLTGVTEAQSGYLYQAILTNATCATPTLSSSVSLTVNSLPAVTTQPSSVTLCSGSNHSFTAAGTGTGISYQWQVSTDGGTTFTDLAGETNPSLNLNNIPAGLNNNQYHLVISGTCSPAAITNNVTLTVVSPVTVTAQPANAAVCFGSNTSFTAAGSGTGVLYQWQVNTGSGFTNIAGATTATLNINGATLAENGNQYQVLMSNATCTTPSVSNAATLTVNALPNVTSSADDNSVCTGSNVVLTATGATTYTWNPGGLTGSPVTVTPTVNPNNPGTPLDITYTVTGTDGNGCVNTSQVTVTAEPLPVVTLTANPPQTRVHPGITVLLTASVTPAANYEYTWRKNGVIIANSTDSLRVGVADMGEYTVTANVVGATCANVSNAIAIQDSASTTLFIYPNPNNGQFTIAFHNPGGVRYDNLPPQALIAQRVLTVFDAKGARVYSRKLTAAQTYELIKVNMTPASAGTYFVELRDASGVRLASGKVVVQN